MVILGAGPTGLGAGYRLKELGYTNFHLFDRHPYIGGLAASFTDEQGFTWDIGGHVMFSHYTYYDECFTKLMGDHFTLNNRESWVRMMDTWVPYPFQNNVRYLPRQATYECLSGLVKAQTGRGPIKSPAEARNFGEFIDAVFGEGIARHFMRPYNFKVWAHPPEMMNKHWIGERVAVIDIDRAIKNVVLGTDDFGWGPNNQFKFPLTGGTGEFYKRFGPVLDGHVTLNSTVSSIDVDRKLIHFADGRLEKYDLLISAMPLDVLCRDVIEGEVPQSLRTRAAQLKHSGGYMVGIGLKRPGGTPDTKSWMYFPEDNCPFYRVTYLSNYSPRMTPDKDNYFSLLCETSYSDLKPVKPDTIVEETIQGLINCGMLAESQRADIVSHWVYHADYSYPTPSVDRDDILADVIPWLEEHSIYSRGRFGMWKYEVANTDHTLMQGVEVVNRLILGEAETTIGMVYKVTEDGRNAASHERPAHAGSGEKRLAKAAAEAEAKPAIAAATSLGAIPVGDVEEADVAEEEPGVTRSKR
ncbi:MAG: FAD-dependent oxidoreductase [Phycisphaerales bacterium]|nr:FAD-dependent oxidoreductase [Phycisphaerales bacterium]